MICNEATFMDWITWGVWLAFMAVSLRWMYRNYAKSPLDRAIERLSADALEDIYDFLDSPVGGRDGINQYISARLDRLQLEIESHLRLDRLQRAIESHLDKE